MEYLLVILKILLGIFYAIVIMKLSGKANLAPTSAFDQINNYILGGIVGSVLFNKNITFLEFFFVLSVWAIITLSITYLRKKSMFFKRLIDGEEVEVIKQGKIIRSGVEKAKISVQDLYLKLRLQGVYDIESVELARIEQNGQLLVLSSRDNDVLPKFLVVDKVVYEDALKDYTSEEDWLDNYLKDNHIKSLDDIASIELYDGQVRIIHFK